MRRDKSITCKARRKLREHTGIQPRNNQRRFDWRKKGSAWHPGRVHLWPHAVFEHGLSNGVAGKRSRILVAGARWRFCAWRNLHHVLNRGNAAERFLRELAEFERQR